MNLIKLPMMLFLICTVTACTKVKTVEYYEQHVEEAKKVEQECIDKQSKGKAWEGKFKENCQNAGKVANRHLINDFMKKQMGL